MEILADAMPETSAMPKSTGGMADILSLPLPLDERAVNATVDAEAG